MRFDPITASPAAVAKYDPRKPAVSLAESRHFKLSEFDIDPADELDLWAALLESAALCTRLARKGLRQVRPLSQVADLVPPLSKGAIHTLHDLDAAVLVVRLREAADRMRAETPDAI